MPLQDFLQGLFLFLQPGLFASPLRLPAIPPRKIRLRAPAPSSSHLFIRPFVWPRKWPSSASCTASLQVTVLCLVSYTVAARTPCRRPMSRAPGRPWAALTFFLFLMLRSVTHMSKKFLFTTRLFVGFLSVLAVLFTVLPCAGQALAAPDVRTQFSFAQDEHGSAIACLSIRIPAGYHAYAHDPGDVGRPASLSLLLSKPRSMSTRASSSSLCPCTGRTQAHAIRPP